MTNMERQHIFTILPDDPDVDGVFVFSTIDNLKAWLQAPAALSYSVAKYCGAYHLPKAGTYRYTEKMDVFDCFVAYVRYYDTPQTHPHIKFPYLAWATLFRKF